MLPIIVVAGKKKTLNKEDIMFGAGNGVDPTTRSASYNVGYLKAEEAFRIGLDPDVFLATERISDPEELEGFRAAYRELLERYSDEATAELLRQSVRMFVEDERRVSPAARYGSEIMIMRKPYQPIISEDEIRGLMKRARETGGEFPYRSGADKLLEKLAREQRMGLRSFIEDK